MSNKVELCDMSCYNENAKERKMEEARKLSLAIEIVENEIAECMIKLRKSKDESLEEQYKKLIETRDKIYKGNKKEIDEMIKKVSK